MKTEPSRVAVIMSVYKNDQPQALTDAAESILNQSYPCDLYLFQDGPLSELLSSTLQNICNNSRVKFYSVGKNRGLAHALNFLIDRVVENDYEFVARMDSDDISRPERILEQVKFLNKNSEVDVCGTSCKEFGASFALEEKHLPKSHNELIKFSCTRCPFIHPTVMFRTKVFFEGCRYPTNTSMTEDMALWFELLKRGYRFANLNKILLDYRLDENTILRRKGIQKAISEFRVRTKNMFVLKQFSLINMLLICSRFIFHLMPDYLIKLAYKKAR